MNHEQKKSILINAGQALFGERWQTEIARSLGISDASRIRQWLSGKRPIPDGIWSDLEKLLMERKKKIDYVLKEIKPLLE